MRCRRAATRRSAALITIALALGSCARASGPHEPRAHAPKPATAAPAADSVTVALWRLDETGGPRVADSGPFRLDATAGLETRTDFGRFKGARVFTRAMDSFVYAPYNPVLESDRGLTVEAWIRPTAFGQYEDTPIAARWNENANQQSWLFAIAGRNLKPPVASLTSPGYHNTLLLQPRAVGKLFFAFMPAEAGPPRVVFSLMPVLLDRWTHVAASYDGDVVKIFINGLLDAQYAARGSIRKSDAPLLIGNYFDPRRLTTFGGDLRVHPNGDNNPYYAYEGFIDELRISSTGRSEFPGVE